MVDSGASVHVLIEKDLSLDEMETLRRSRNSYVHDLDLFVVVQLLDDTPAVLSLGKLCEDYGYSYEWARGQKPRLTKEEQTITGKTEKILPLVVFGLSSNSGNQFVLQIATAGLVSTSSSPPPERSDEPRTSKLARVTKK